MGVRFGLRVGTPPLLAYAVAQVRVRVRVGSIVWVRGSMLPLLVSPIAQARVRVRVGSTLWVRGRHATPTGLCDGAGGPDADG